MTGTSSGTALDELWSALDRVAASTKPRNMLPVSPMKIEAGLKL